MSIRSRLSSGLDAFMERLRAGAERLLAQLDRLAAALGGRGARDRATRLLRRGKPAQALPGPDPSPQRGGEPPRFVDPRCPHCGKELVPPPVKNRLCPYCGQNFFVRTLPNYQRRIMREDELDELHQARRKRNDEMAQHHIRALGLDQAEVEKVRAELAGRLGREPPSGDIFWGLATQRLAERPEASAQTYYEMALFLFEEGRPHEQVLADHHRAELNRLLQVFGPAAMVSIAGADACGACQSLSGRRLSVEAALKEMPLPVRGCSKGSQPGFCRCRFKLEP